VKQDSFKPKAKHCPVCRNPLVSIDFPYSTIKGNFTRATQACPKCEIFVVIHRVRKQHLSLIRKATNAPSTPD
jgi:ribosomal protein S27AE